jgi:transposase
MQMPSTIGMDPVIYLAIELASPPGVVSKIPTSEKTGLHRMEASDSQALLALIADLRKKVAAKLGVETAVVSCFEAGRDGFWLHRLLSEHGVINHVAEPKRTPNASIVSENISSRKGFASRSGLLTF